MRSQWPKLRQLSFPPAFRIETQGSPDDYANLLVAAVSEALAARDQGTSAVASINENSSSGINEDFAVALCNYQFRIGRNAELLKADGQGSKELRVIERMLQRINTLLIEYGIESLDLTGQTYDVLREDFEPLGEPERVPGLDGNRIGSCERPVVIINGKLIQRAKGLVRKPS